MNTVVSMMQCLAALWRTIAGLQCNRLCVTEGLKGLAAFAGLLRQTSVLAEHHVQ